MKLSLAILAAAVSVMPVSAYAATTRTVQHPEPIKEIALTFDDGPYGTSTQRVLAILAQQQVHATFFLMGHNVAEFPEEARQILAAGNVIGNHTYSHPNLATLTTRQALADIARGEAEIATVTGVHAQLFRPPYGVLPKGLRKPLRQLGYKTMLWNDDPQDWNYASSTSSLIVSRALAQKKTHTILILHDGRDTRVNYPRENMLEALPSLIEDFKQQGYRFVTL